ncbi:glycosyltransferase [Mycobacterium sp. Root135]|uniref:glycosyltransferase n=1 Tax=Mycobacterium sp. Root135 TaxID=1736457 RepID=UPI000A92AF88|nr:glycosyltransferase [Mycobacterium sp. Root135]
MSGIGIVQKHLYAFLAEGGHELVFSKPRDVGGAPYERVMGLMRGFRPAVGSVDVYLSVVPPLPYGVDAPLLTLVHDLRWLRTRSKIGTAYRAWDLRRTVRTSDSLICISENTRTNLVEFVPTASKKATVQWLGAGLIPDRSFEESDSGLVMLVGGAPHKCNELAAEALSRARPAWVQGIIGVGVSERVRDTLSNVFPCEWPRKVSESDMIALYRRAQFFMMLGTDEGFGLPFVEALAAGCQVIATDHSLTREVVGSAGTLLLPGDADAVARQLQFRPSVPVAERVGHVQNFSWRLFGEACEAALIKILHESGSPTARNKAN